MNTSIILSACAALDRQKTSHNMKKSNQRQTIMMKMDITDQVMKKKSKMKSMHWEESKLSWKKWI